MERWRGRVALVTGASAGIGKCVAKALAERGMLVVACARNPTAIEELAKELKGKPGMVKAVKCDVSKQAEVEAMFKTIRQDKNLGRVDVCINNAGVGPYGRLLENGPEQWKLLSDVNVEGLLMVTKEACKLMQEKKINDGHIIIMNSILGKAVLPLEGTHCYSASKFAVDSIAEGLRQELREMKTKIRVSQICPGVVKTDFMKNNFTQGNQEASEAMYSQFTHLFPEDIRDLILYMLAAPPHVELGDVVITPVG